MEKHSYSYRRATTNNHRHIIGSTQLGKCERLSRYILKSLQHLSKRWGFFFILNIIFSEAMYDATSLNHIETVGGFSLFHNIAMHLFPAIRDNLIKRVFLILSVGKTDKSPSKINLGE